MMLTSVTQILSTLIVCIQCWGMFADYGFTHVTLEYFVEDTVHEMKSSWLSLVFSGLYAPSMTST